MDGRDKGKEGRKEDTKQVIFVVNHQRKIFFNEMYKAILFLKKNTHISLSRQKKLSNMFSFALNF